MTLSIFIKTLIGTALVVITMLSVYYISVGIGYLVNKYILLEDYEPQFVHFLLGAAILFGIAIIVVMGYALQQVVFS